MLNGRLADILKPALIVLTILITFSPSVFPQEQVIIMDTSDYQPYPDGRHINLAIASSKGYPLEIKRLISLGAQVNFVDNIGATPLIYAVANNREVSVTTLLDYSPNLDVHTSLGETALHIAAKESFVEIAEYLLRSDADINILDYYGCTPIHYAAFYGLYYMSDLLIYYDAKLNIKSLDGTTPLMAATWAGHAEIADLLIKSGADVNIEDNKGFTALHIAAQNEDTLISRLLIDNGAKISAKNKEGLDIASIAARIGSEEYSEFILSRTDWVASRDPEATEPAILARKYAKMDTYKIFKEYSSQKVSPIFFDQVQIATNSKLNIHDIYLGGRISFIETLYNLRANIGFEFKPAYTRVLQEEDENVFFQYFDKRYLASVGIGKGFLISDNYFSGTTAIILNLNFGYMIANKYRGTSITPPDRYLLMPSVGLERTFGPVSLVLAYEYMNTGLYKAGPNWLKIEISYNLHFSDKSPSLKNIKWY